MKLGTLLSCSLAFSILFLNSFAQATPISTAITPKPNEALSNLLAAEIAAHRQDYDFAYTALFKEVEKTKNPKLAEALWQVAINRDNTEDILKVCDLWLSFEPSAFIPLQTRVISALTTDNSDELAQALKTLDSTQSKLERKGHKGDWYAKLLETMTNLPANLFTNHANILSVYNQKYNQNVSVLLALGKFQAAHKKAPEACQNGLKAYQLKPSEQTVIAAADLCWSPNVKASRKILSEYNQKHKSKNPYLSILYGRTLVATGQTKTARALLDSVLMQKDLTSQTLLNAGQLALDLQKNDLAEKVFNRYLQAYEAENAEADLSQLSIWFQLAQLADKRHDYDKVLDYLNHMAPNVAAIAGKARVYLVLNQPKEALSALNKGLRNFPKDPVLLLQKAVVLDRLNQQQEALDLLLDLDKANPNNAIVLNAIGLQYVNIGKNLKQAESYLKRAQSLSPQNPAVLDALGWLEFKKHNYIQSYKYIRQSIDKGFNVEVAKHLIEVLVALNNPSEAQKALDQTVEIVGATPELEVLANRLHLKFNMQPKSATNAKK